MYSHIFVGVTDFERAFAFYQPVMATLGLELRFKENHKPWAAWHSADGNRPFFIISCPFDGETHVPGNGQMIAFLAVSRNHVDEVYRAAIAAGAHSEGLPGLRPEYHPHYYGAYFRDLDGNKLAVASHRES